jgi:DNA-binding transcriptional regulator/RsmH inhibitor MraZ
MPKRREEDQGGLARHSIDGSGRMKLTADELPALAGGANLLLWIDPCARLCTDGVLAELEAWVKEVFPDLLRQDWIRRRTLGTKRRVVPDETGRIRIPLDYLEYIGLDKRGVNEAILVPVREGLYEIWQPARYKSLGLGSGVPQMAYDGVPGAAALGGSDGGTQPPVGNGG